MTAPFDDHLNELQFKYLKSHTRCSKFVDMLYFLDKDVDKNGLIESKW